MPEFAPSDFVALGGLVVAGLALLLGYLDRQRARSESYRAALYTAQLAAASEIVRAAGRVHHEALALTRGDAEIRQLDVAVADLDIVRGSGDVLLPGAISQAVFDDLQTVLDATLRSTTRPAENRREVVHQSWERLLASVRRELGSRELGRQIHDLTGVARTRGLEAVLAEVRRVEDVAESHGRNGSAAEPPARDDK